MVGNDVPIDVLLDRTVQQLEHAEAQNAQLRAALERLINVPAKDTKAVDEAWDLARQALAATKDERS